MDNTQFMEFVTEELRKARGYIPESGKGASFNKPVYEHDSSTGEFRLGIRSDIIQGLGRHDEVTSISYGVELCFKGFEGVEQKVRANTVTRGFFNENTAERAFIRIRDIEGLQYELLALGDLETIAEVTSNNILRYWKGPEQEVRLPDVSGMKTKEAIPLLFQTLYQQ